MKKKSKRKLTEITDYDQHDTTAMIDRSHPLEFVDLGLKLPKEAPSQVISIRLPQGSYIVTILFGYYKLKNRFLTQCDL